MLNWKLNPGKAWIAAVGVTVAGAIIQCLIVFVHRLRARIHSKYFTAKEAKKDILILTC